MTDDIQAIIRTTLQVKIVEALKNTPEAIDELVRAAISKPVDDPTNRYGSKLPYLDVVAGDAIREAARNAVRKIVTEMQPKIEDAIRARFTENDVVGAIASSFIGAAQSDYRINISFEKEKN